MDDLLRGRSPRGCESCDRCDPLELRCSMSLRDRWENLRTSVAMVLCASATNELPMPSLPGMGVLRSMGMDATRPSGLDSASTAAGFSGSRFASGTSRLFAVVGAHDRASAGVSLCTAGSSHLRSNTKDRVCVVSGGGGRQRARVRLGRNRHSRTWVELPDSRAVRPQLVEWSSDGCCAAALRPHASRASSCPCLNRLRCWCPHMRRQRSRRQTAHPPPRELCPRL